MKIVSLYRILVFVEVGGDVDRYGNDSLIVESGDHASGSSVNELRTRNFDLNTTSQEFTCCIL